MSVFALSRDLWPELKKALGLPDGVTKCTLIIETDALVTVTIERMAEQEQYSEAVKVLERYRVVKIEDPSRSDDGGGGG